MARHGYNRATPARETSGALALLTLVFLTSALVALAAAARRHPLAREAAALALLCALAAGFYWRLLAGDAFAPSGGGDLASFLYPYYVFAAQSLSLGRFPGWNPYVFSGMPFLADVQSGYLYPINLLQFALGRPSYSDMQALSILHVLLAGMCAYLCLRALPRLALPPCAALLGAVAFMFSDLFVLHFGNLNMIAAAAWFPLVFLLFALAAERQSLLLAGWSGAALGISALAGHVQPTLYNSLFLAGYCAWLVAERALAGLGWRRAWRPVLLLVAAAVAAALVSLPATLPAFVVSRETARADFSYWQASRFSLSPLRLIGVVLPDLFGRDPAVYWGLGDRVESGYLGMLPLALALFAALRLRDRPWVPFLSLAAGFLALVSLGDTTPLHGWLYSLVPGFRLLRAPSRAIYLADFAISALAAIAASHLSQAARPAALGLQARRFAATLARYGLPALALLFAASFFAILLLQDRDPVIFSRAWLAAGSISRAAIVLGATIVALRAASSATRPGRAAAWLVGVVLVSYLDLASAGANLDLAPRPPTAGFQHDAAVAFLKSDLSPHRIDVDPAAASLWQPNMGMLYGIENVRGVANPMELERYNRFAGLAESRSSRLYDLLGAKYVVMSKGAPPAEPKLVPVFGDDPTVDIYLHREALPLVLLLHEVVAVAGPDEAAAALAAPDFFPDTAIVLEGRPDPVMAAAGPERLWFDERGTDAVRLGVEASASAYVLLTTPYSAGWLARLDGQLVRVWHADLAFMAVAVPPGEHVVEFVYRPPLFRAALALSLASLTALVALSLARRASGRRRTRDCSEAAPPSP